jgi:hypothetical protein
MTVSLRPGKESIGIFSVMLEAGISAEASGWQLTAEMAIQVGAVSDLATGGHSACSP